MHAHTKDPKKADEEIAMNVAGALLSAIPTWHLSNLRTEQLERKSAKNATKSFFPKLYEPRGAVLEPVLFVPPEAGDT